MFLERKVRCNLCSFSPSFWRVRVNVERKAKNLSCEIYVIFWTEESLLSIYNNEAALE